MKGILQNKIALLGIGAVVIVVGIAIFIFVQNSKKASVVEGPEETVEEQAIQMSPEDIGLKLTANSNNTEVTMEITDVSKFNSFEYEMNYDAEIDGEMVPRGAIGSGDVEVGETTIRKEITIGTCSSGKCKYDTGVAKVSFVIRLNLKDGQTGIVKDELVLE
ncbi:MAG: hypothetical protein Q7T54_01190 [Candidatus Levybacteria bacterium]|nr:hypothetical protein [Candidatus Levybacteria bacterium]